MREGSRRRHDDVDLERDRALVERAQAGDERAFEDLYIRYRDRLYRFCLRRTGSASEAEDLVQEAFARAWKALPRFQGERRFYPWLSVIANHLCADLARRGGRCTPVEESTLEVMAPSVASEQEAYVDSAGDGQLLAAAMGRLSPRHREVLELREGRNWSYQQIAAHSGVEVSTIETLLFRARRSLRREFLTLTETGLAGVLAFPFLLVRRGLRRLRHLVAHPAGAELTAASGVSGTAIASGVAVVLTAAALTTGALLGTHPSGTLSAASEHTSLPLATGASPAPTGALAAGSGRLAPRGGGGTTGGASGSSPASGTASTKAGQPAGGTSAGGSGTGGVLSGVGGTVGGVVGSAGSTVNKLVGSAGSTVSSGVSSVTSGVSSTVSGVSGTVSGVSSGVSGTVSSVSSGLSGTVSSISSGVSSITGSGLP
ncbi:MAG TPA: RNA polymerase sigma factor [Acidimicrobiales bacterium]|nr:RNA polymerase sigma factor [Acidimicrobiales bacterium]